MEKPQVGTEKDGANKNLSKKEKSSSKILKTTVKPQFKFLIYVKCSYDIMRLAHWFTLIKLIVMMYELD